MKKLIHAALAVFLLFTVFAGCGTKPVEPAADAGSLPDSGASHNGPETASPAESSPAPSEPVQPSEPLRLEDITFDDEERVRKLIASYFGALEREDYEAAWHLLSARQQEEYPLEQALAEHWGLKAVRLVSMKGILPPYIAEKLPPYDMQMMDAPEDTPTVWFMVTLNITKGENAAWDAGENTRFVNVVREDGAWKIDGLGTSP